MSSQRLSNLAILSIEQHRANCLNMDLFVDEFAAVHSNSHRRIQGGGLRWLKPPLKFFQIRFLIDGSRHRNIQWGDFLDNLELNHFLHRDREENIKCKAYLAEFGQSKCVYFTINKTSNKYVFILKNMVPILYKYVSVYIKYLQYITYTLHKPHVHRRSQGGRGP